MKLKRNHLVAILILAFVVGIYVSFGLINQHLFTLRCENGHAEVPDDSSQFMLLTGEWLRYSGAPDPDQLRLLEETPVDITHIGFMEGNTFLIQLSGENLKNLSFMLPRARGSQVFIDGRKVIPASGGNITSADVFRFSDYLNPALHEHNLVLQIPLTGRYYSGYQGIILGEYNPLLLIDQFRYFADNLCIGMYIALVLFCIVLFLQKHSETYILYLIIFTLISAYRFMSFSDHFAVLPLFQKNYQFYRFFFFMRYVLCRAFIHPPQLRQKPFTDYAIIGMTLIDLLVYVFMPSRFSEISIILSHTALAIEGILIAKGILANLPGFNILLAGWAVYAGREVFYTALQIGFIPQGIVDVLIRPTQYAHLVSLIAFTATVLGKFARKFSEAEEMTVSLEQKVLEQTQELREKNQRIIEEQNQRQQFMTDVVHNLRNPLFALGGYMELLESQMDQPTAEQQKYVGLIEDKLAYVNRMVDDMLLANRLEHGKIRFHFIRLELSAFLRSVVMGNKRLEQCGLVHISCPELYLAADSFRLHQALDNLLDNAVIHGGCTSMEITAYQEESIIHLTICDNGKGMTAEQVSRAFDRYYTSGQKNSTGLGLAITAAIIRGHGGQITLDSTPGEGVIIHIALPVESHETDETFDEMKEA